MDDDEIERERPHNAISNGRFLVLILIVLAIILVSMLYFVWPLLTNSASIF